MGSGADDGNMEDRFGRRVRIERERRGWTQSDLAKQLEEQGISLHPSAIAKIELRDAERPRAIRLDEAHALARAFGLSIGDMYETKDNQIRTARYEIRLWLQELIEHLNQGELLGYECLALVDSFDESERDKVRDLLTVKYFHDIVEPTQERANIWISVLRHPSREGVSMDRRDS